MIRNLIINEVSYRADDRKGRPESQPRGEVKQISDAVPGLRGPNNCQMVDIMYADPVENLHNLLDKYTYFKYIPDIGNYRKITGFKKGSCMFRGCTEPISWENMSGSEYLCEGHYLTIKKWVYEARAAMGTNRLE